MIKITWTVTPRTIELMRNKGARVVSVLTTKITILMQQLSSYVATQKLSGQVLNVKSGILRGSIHALPTTIEGTKITGAVEGAGGPAFYGHVHEFGGKSMFEIAPVKARALRFVSGGETRFATHVLHPPLPTRSFMRTSEAENAAKIFAELNEAVNKVVNEK